MFTSNPDHQRTESGDSIEESRLEKDDYTTGCGNQHDSSWI